MTKKTEMFYKYRAVNTFTLESLYNDKIYYSNPGDFNDPFDCNPIIECDSSKEELETLLASLIKDRVANESKALLQKLRLNDESAERHANKVADLESRDALLDIKYNATNPDYKISEEQAELALLTESILREIKKHYSKGIFSLASDCEDPLMWSHYADKHKGICVGYSLERTPPPKPQKAVYGGSRVIKTSTIHNALLKGSKKALDELDKAILLRKAKEWKYEKEWRLIGNQGVQDSPLLLKEIIFGLRCDSLVIHTIINGLKDRSSPVKFYQMDYSGKEYNLKKEELDLDELSRTLPKEAQIIDMFDDIEIN